MSDELLAQLLGYTLPLRVWFLMHFEAEKFIWAVVTAGYSSRDIIHEDEKIGANRWGNNRSAGKENPLDFVGWIAASTKL